MSAAPYVPDVGHIVWLSLDPQRGREQAGRRPFLVLSPRAYNAKTSLAVGVPVTSVRKGYPFEVPLDSNGRISGVALADQVKSLDWRARLADYAEDVPLTTLQRVRALIATLLDVR
ncbi:MAG TPA: endoribonuclease MazF [Candidatus Acidoferrales bacterium]|nr:endoribonuclease MazF [Candidatus Acidoferrales bacterium]